MAHMGACSGSSRQVLGPATARLHGHCKDQDVRAPFDAPAKAASAEVEAQRPTSAVCTAMTMGGAAAHTREASE